MSKFSNMIKLMVLLKGKKRVKAKELADSLNVSERMVRKYIDDLNEAGVDIVSVQGPSGGYEIKCQDYLINTNITENEFVALNYATRELVNSNFKMKDELESLNSKMAIIKNEKVKEQEYIYGSDLSINESYVREEQNNELDIHVAIIKMNKIKVEYESVSSAVSERVLHPYEIMTRKNSKYLIAYCEKSDKVKTFKLVRFNYIEILEDKYEIEEDFDISVFKRNFIGVFTEEAYYTKLIIRNPMAKVISERQVASKQKIKWLDKDSIYFEGEMYGREDTVRWILSLKEYVTIIEPLKLKEEVRNVLSNMISVI